GRPPHRMRIEAHRSDQPVCLNIGQPAAAIKWTNRLKIEAPSPGVSNRKGSARNFWFWHMILSGKAAIFGIMRSSAGRALVGDDLAVIGQAAGRHDLDPALHLG